MRSRRHRLIVADDARTLSLAKNTLSHDYDLSTARDALQSVDLLLAERFDLLIIILALPVVDGVELIQILRRQARFRRIPIIALPAGPEALIPLDALAVDSILPGPFSIDELHLASEVDLAAQDAGSLPAAAKSVLALLDKL